MVELCVKYCQFGGGSGFQVIICASRECAQHSVPGVHRDNIPAPEKLRGMRMLRDGPQTARPFYDLSLLLSPTQLEKFKLKGYPA